MFHWLCILEESMVEFGSRLFPYMTLCTVTRPGALKLTAYLVHCTVGGLVYPGTP